MPQPKSSNRSRWYVYPIVIVIIIALAGFWFKATYLSPQQVFWGMVSNNLSTRSVTTEVTQTSGSNALKQIIQFDLGTTRLVHAYTDLKEGPSEVKTEMLGTPQADYSRYVSIKTDEKTSQGKPISTSGVINIWSKSDAQPTTQNNEHLFSQALLGVRLGDVPIPIGEVTPNEASQLITTMQQGNTYSVSFASNNVSKTFKQGRLLYTYQVKVEPVSYLAVMKAFATDEGLSDLNSLNPNAYASDQPFQVTLTVDALSHQLVSVNTGQGYVQSYEAYGVPVDISVPAHPISATELQSRISKLQ